MLRSGHPKIISLIFFCAPGPAGGQKVPQDPPQVDAPLRQDGDIFDGWISASFFMATPGALPRHVVVHTCHSAAEVLRTSGWEFRLGGPGFQWEAPPGHPGWPSSGPAGPAGPGRAQAAWAGRARASQASPVGHPKPGRWSAASLQPACLVRQPAGVASKPGQPARRSQPRASQHGHFRLEVASRPKFLK